MIVGAKGTRCPLCGSRRVVELSPHMLVHHDCPKHGGRDVYFDDEPDEGGDYSTDPTRRAERLERKRRG